MEVKERMAIRNQTRELGDSDWEAKVVYSIIVSKVHLMATPCISTYTC